MRRSVAMRSSIVAGSSPTDGARQRRRADRQRAEAIDLDDRRVAEVGLHLVERVARIQRGRVRHRRRTREPAPPRSRQPDPDLDAVARDDGHQRRAGDPPGADERELREDHRDVQEELAVGAHERVDLVAERGERVGDQRGAGLGAVMALVAELQRARVQVEEVERAVFGERPRELRREHVAHPDQTRDDLLVVGAVAQDLARALVQRTPRRRAGRLVARHEDRHRAGHDAGHRADAAGVVVGQQRDRAGVGERKRRRRVAAADALQRERDAERRAHRAAHRLRRDRRPGVARAAGGEVRDDVTRRHDADELRPGRRKRGDGRI
jgi:hypothetical protein